MAGLSLAKLGGLAEIPFGIGMSLGFALLGVLIQFAINKPDEDEYDDEEEKETETDGEDETEERDREESIEEE